MARGRQPIVKQERAQSPPPRASATPLTPMGPPSRVRPGSERLDAQSAAMSFTRSGAPSVTTYNQEEDPILMEIRGPAQPNTGSEEPTQQNADLSFAHQSFVHPTFTDIGMKLRAYNDTHANLQRLGVAHETAAKLPELVLVGDQSAGKSSLMCGIARVNIPRSAGVGTRCPLHIQLSDDSRWSCTVTLQLDYDFAPKGKIRKSDVTANNPFPPWVKRAHRDIKLFKTIFEEDEIEEVLRWAQIAILNPASNHELFIPRQGAVAREEDLTGATRMSAAQFSPNIISLQIKGPEFFNLSFYDLPGVFLAPEQEEDEYIVKVVRNLSRHYIEREKAIIMWALPMNADPENSISLGIIREAKATARTIGIMTKADMLAADNESQWLAMFRREKQSVGHGFFATCRRPNDSIEAANKWEELFFDHESHGNGECSWPTAFDDYKQRCGVDRLSRYISERLGHAFAETLPEVKSKVAIGLREIEHQLAGLPELPSNVEHEVKRSVTLFLTRMKSAIKDPEFCSQWVKLNNQFRDVVQKIKPTCVVKEPIAATIDLSDADTEVSVATPSRRPRPSDSTVRPTPTKRVRQELTPMTPVKQEGAAPIYQTPRAASVTSIATFEISSPFLKFRNLGRGNMAMDIREIRAEIRKKQRPGMPRDLVPDEVREALCLNAVRKWEGPLEAYIEKTAELLELATNQVLEESLGTLRRRLIFKECQAYLKEFIGQAVTKQRARLVDMYNSECYQMYMLNEDAFSRYKGQELDILRRARAIYRLKAVAFIEWEYEIKQPDAMSDEERVKEHKLLAAHLPKIGPDPFETEIEVAAFVRGYYLMAATRFVEGVTMNVNSFLFRAITDFELDMFVNKKLRIYDADASHVYAHLMEEDETTARLREELKDRQKRLTEAMESIHALESSATGESPVDTDFSAHSSHYPMTIDLEDDVNEEGTI
ncbi:dynamin family protein [Xylariaceae sp. FL0255]|nr:dynamin family protein [Xylariaceae sp. FL0255]